MLWPQPPSHPRHQKHVTVQRGDADRRVTRSFAQQPACSIHSSFSHGQIENLRFFTRAKKNWRKRKSVKHMWLYSSGFLGKAVVTKCAKEGEAYELSGCHFGRWSKCFCSLMDINIEGEILPFFLAWTPTNIWKKPSSMGSNEVTIRQLVLQKVTVKDWKATLDPGSTKVN